MATQLEQAIKRLGELDPASVLVLGDIVAERVRQLEAEGWTPQHDDDLHADGGLAAAAACYALDDRSGWPWAAKWWKPRGHHRNCIKAAALLVAELARILRLDVRGATANERSSA